MSDAQPSTSRSSESSPHSGRILLVEDDAHIAEGIQFNLEQESYQVEVAGDGRSAVEQLADSVDNPFDLVILDLVMPGASGLEVLAKIRSDPKRGSVPVIILTAKGQDTDRQAALAGGADDFLTKPFSPKKLVARIREILDDG